MICAFCGEEFRGRPIKDGEQIYCSIACADMAASGGNVDEEEEGYYEEDTLEYESFEDEDVY